MKFVRQPTNTTCGQACVAMLVDVPINRVIEDIGGGRTNTADLAGYLNGFRNVPYKAVRYNKGQDLPSPCIVKLRPDPPQKRYLGHWVVYKKGKFYDPGLGVFRYNKFQEKLAEKGMKVTSFLDLSKSVGPSGDL